MAGTITASIVKNDTTSPPQFQNSVGTEVGTLCRAWVNFNGTTAAIRASFNVGSITKNGTGDYTVNFITPMPDANYSILGMHADVNNASSSTRTVSSTAGSARIATFVGSTGPFDSTVTNVAIFR